jgi:hypothetical protein
MFSINVQKQIPQYKIEKVKEGEMSEKDIEK